MTASDQFQAHLQDGKLSKALDVFADLDDQRAQVDTLIDICDELSINDFDVIPLGLRLCDTVIPLAGERSDAHMWKLAALQRRGAFDDAFAFAQEHKKRPPVLIELYEMCCVHERLDDALALIGDLRALGDGKAGQALYNLGCKFQGGGKLEQAFALHQGAIALGEPRPQADINAGIALLKLGRSTDAAQLARNGIDHTPGDPNLWANLLDALAIAGEPAPIREAVAGARSVLGNSSRCGDCDHASSVVECTIGCSALLDDMMNAMISIGDHAAALDLYASHSPDGVAAFARLNFTRARALAADGDAEQAHAVLDSKLDDAGTFDFYRARAAAAHAGGDNTRAIGALAAALHAEPDRIAALRRDAAFALIADQVDSKRATPIRPPSLPDGAQWDAGENEWTYGDTDAPGRKQGMWNYYRPDGTLCNECPMVDDKPHGAFKRFHENGDISQDGDFRDGQLHGTRRWLSCDQTTTEAMHTSEISRSIQTSEMDYDNGRVTEIRHYDGDARLVAADGTLYPERPDDVPTAAFYQPKNQTWRFGELDDNGKKCGMWRTWNQSGTMLVEEEMAGTERHGSYRELHADGTVAVTGQYDEDDKTGTFVMCRDADGTAPEGFPTVGTKVVRVNANHDKYVTYYHYFDAQGRESMLDGTPLNTFADRHPALATWLEEIRAIDWTTLEDASEDAHFVPQILINLLVEDDADSEELSDAVFGDLYWHLCHQGTIYSATAVAVPFIIRLLAYGKTPHKAALLSFLKNTACAPPHIVAQAREEMDGWQDFLATYDAIMRGVDVYIDLLATHPDTKVRTAVTRILGAAYDRSADVTAALLSAVDSDAQPVVQNSALFTLGRMSSAAATMRLQSTLTDPGLPGVCAALALAMAHGPEAGETVVNRLLQALETVDELSDNYAELSWADDEMIAEIGQALAYAGGGAPVLAKLTASFDTIDALSSMSLVKATLDIAFKLGEGELTDELRHVLTSLANSDKPWVFDVNLGEILDEYELPNNREELLQLAQQ